MQQRFHELYRQMNVSHLCLLSLQERFHELYRQMNDDSALPMATPMLMQDVLSDGLAFCAVM